MAPKALKLANPDWDSLVEAFNTSDFIPNDPISIPHRYRHSTDSRDVECTAFIAALFSYGRRDKILETLDKILSPLGDAPAEYLASTTPQSLAVKTKGFYYRFNGHKDLVFLLTRLGEIYRTEDSLKSLWQRAYQPEENLQLAIHRFRQVFLHEGTASPPSSYGMKFLFADPMQNSAAKRFNMFLRWMVRQDAVDLGLWSDIMPAAALRFPLDTHVAAMARKYDITQRLSNDWKTVEEITHYFRKHCPTDPVKYDFALFGLGLSEK